MLKNLKIQNLLFVKEAEISFEKGLNIFTGETGAGKSAFLEAIRLIAGHRADLKIIGNHKEVAVVEATLHGIQAEEIIIRREMHKSGKTRCFVNDELVPLTALKQMTSRMIEVVDQASSSLLSKVEEQRFFLDLFAGSLNLAKELEKEVTKTDFLQKELETLLSMNATRERDLAWEEEDLSLIEKVAWKEDEEESLSKEHLLLIHAQELEEKLSLLSEILSGANLRKALSLIDAGAKLDASLSPFAGKLRSISLELDEFSHQIHSHIHKIETDPTRLEKVEERMQEIEGLKRRFGKTFDAVEKKKEECLKKIDHLKNLDEKIVSLKQELLEQRKKSESLSKLLSTQRKNQAPLLEKAILSELKSLNLPHARFQIVVTETALTSHGIDAIDFLFSANPDRAPVSIQDCASGGELSRLFLSLKTALAEKEDTNCLVFDEIDGNVGGQTAVVLGEKLKTIAQKKQVICITHFIQVARFATLHFCVTKKQQQGNTTTHISLLDDKGKEKEYERMLGSPLKN